MSLLNCSRIFAKNYKEFLHFVLFVRFLLSSNRDPDVKRWAAEGLSYLTLDADVKEFVVEDATLIRALVELAKVSNNFK